MNSTVIFAFAVLGLVACGAQSTQSVKGPPAPTQTHAPEPAGEPFPSVRSQDEANANAAAAISKENADAELEKLKKELAGGE